MYDPQCNSDLVNIYKTRVNKTTYNTDQGTVAKTIILMLSHLLP